MTGIVWREPNVPELGYWLGVEYWGQGFGTEASRAAVDFFFETFDSKMLFAYARISNPASRNVLEKCGFHWTGVELHRFEVLGSSAPVDAFRLSRDRWSSLRSWAGAARAARDEEHAPTA
jgi:RimJ/RimL family protein N-acetyltransferase